MDDPASLKTAFQDIYGVFLVVNGWESGFDGEVRQGKHVADLAAESGIRHLVFAAAGTGERGYVLKGADQAAMLRAIRSVANGESLFSPEIARRLMYFFSNLPPQAPDEVFPELTEREREILTLIAKGDTNGDIADKLVISLKTVRNHVSNIFNKLQVADRTQAALRARQAGLGDKKQLSKENIAKIALKSRPTPGLRKCGSEALMSVHQAYTPVYHPHSALHNQRFTALPTKQNSVKQSLPRARTA